MAPVEAFPLSAWRRVLDINLTSNFVAIQAALPAMQVAVRIRRTKHHVQL